MKKAVNTVAEQLIYTASFFLTQALIARSVSVTEFSEFSSFYSTVILLSIIHSCTIAEPILIYIGNSKRPSTKSLLIAHIPACILIAIATYHFNQNASTVETLTYTSALASFLIFWTNRSIAWKHEGILKHSIPAIFQAAGIIILTTYNKATIENIFITISVCLLAPSLLLSKNKQQKEEIHLLDSIKFSALNLTSQTILWGMTHGLVIYYLQTGNPTESSNLRIILTLILPAQYITIALSNYYLPKLSKEIKPTSKAIQFTLVSTAISTTYGIFLYIFGGNLSDTLFGIKYSNLEISKYFALPIILSIIQTTRTILKAHRKNLKILSALSTSGVTFAITYMLTEQLETSSAIGLTTTALLLSLHTIKLFHCKINTI